MNKNNKISQSFQLLWTFVFVVLTAFSSGANAQTTRFEAVIKQDGNIELIPIDLEVPSSVEMGTSMSEAVSGQEFFLVKDPAGTVKGVYADQAAAMDHPLSPGDSVQVLAAAENVAFWPAMEESSDVDEDMLDKVAKEAAKRLLATVKASACEFDPLPETVSPTVEVSFNLFAGTSLSIQATWITEKVCTG